MVSTAFMRRFSNTNQPSLLPLSNMSHSSGTAPRAGDLHASDRYNQPHDTKLSREHQDVLVVFTRQEAYLQKTLQNLLDAQSQGLLAGLGLPPESGGFSSYRAGTPRSASEDNDSKQIMGVAPVRQSVKRKIGLCGARRGISRAVIDLAALKAQEGQVIEGQLADIEEDLMVVQGLASKQTGLEHRIQSIENEDPCRKVKQFKHEEARLDIEIKAMETNLWEMKARQRRLLGQIEGLENTVQSKLSSYKAALMMAEKEATAFLARPKVHGDSFQGAGESLWALPIERRTLGMADEHFNMERERLKQRAMDIDVEKIALEEGLMVWESVVTEVIALEKVLREEMQRLAADSVSNKAEKIGAVRGMEIVLERMKNTKIHIEGQLKIAENRNWKLLVCCIGAEYEAINEGYEVLQTALGTSQNTTIAGGSDANPSSPQDDRFNDAVILHPPEINKPHNVPTGASRSLDRSEDEDDEPGPELLISHMEDE